MQQLENKFKKELKDQSENGNNQIAQLQSTIRRMEKEKNTLNERLELSSKSMMSEHGSIEKKLERIQEERDRIKEEFEILKSEKDRKIEDLKRTFDREKEILM